MTKLGGAPWNHFNLSYQGEKGDSPLKWQTEDFTVWFCNPQMVVHNLLSNPYFDNGFDYAPFQEHDKDGNHWYENFMLGNWCWRQAVCIIYIMQSFFWSLTYLQDEIRKKPSSHGVTLVPIILGSDKTTVSIATSQNEYWPIYISISNIHNNIWWAHHNGVTLLGFLANPKSKSSIHLFFIN